MATSRKPPGRTKWINDKGEVAAIRNFEKAQRGSQTELADGQDSTTVTLSGYAAHFEGKNLTDRETEDLLIDNPISSPPFVLCGNVFACELFPIGCMPYSEHAALRLKNMSRNKVRLSYKLRLINQMDSTKDIVFEDPDGIQDFSPYGLTTDCAWGCDDMILIDNLRNETFGYCHNDTIKIRVDIIMYTEIDIVHHPLTKLIESADKESDLIKLAEDDLSLIIKGMPLEAQNPTEVLFEHQNKIIKALRK